MAEVITYLNQKNDSPARSKAAARKPLRVAAVQERWHGSTNAQMDQIRNAIRQVRDLKPELIVLQELTLYPYACTRPDAQDGFQPEALTGMSYKFAADLAKEFDCNIVISIYEGAPDGNFNTALTISNTGEIVLKTRKTHIPTTTGYYEDKYFKSGDTAPHVANIGEAKIGTPTCYDQWFPELAREYGLLGADLLCYPTAIGSEPDFPDFDTEPAWRATMLAHAIANGFFVAAVNRIGTEDGVTFYGSSFIGDPYGKVLIQADRNSPTVLVADLDLDKKRDWLAAFPFFKARRPDIYRNIAR